MEVREIYSYCTLVLLVLILLTDCGLVTRFRNYYQVHGYGVVTSVLLNLVVTQLVAASLFVVIAILILMGDSRGSGRASSCIGLFKDGCTSWLLSTTLVHVLVLTCLRIYSVSYGNRFLKFVGSSFNVRLVVFKLWFVSLAIPQDQNIDGVRNPHKTFVLFAGILVSFGVFLVPPCIANLYFNFQNELLDLNISLLVALWCLLGVLVNSLWISFRMRCKMNNVDGLYSKWTLEEHNINISEVDIPKRHSVDDHSILPKRHSFRSCDVIEQQYASIASLEEQIRKEIM